MSCIVGWGILFGHLVTLAELATGIGGSWAVAEPVSLDDMDELTGVGTFEWSMLMSIYPCLRK